MGKYLDSHLTICDKQFPGKPMLDEDFSFMLLYAIRYALSHNGEIVGLQVIDFVKPYIEHLHASVLYTLEKDLIYAWESRERIGERMIHDKEWTEFQIAIRAERDRRIARQKKKTNNE